MKSLVYLIALPALLASCQATKPLVDRLMEVEAIPSVPEGERPILMLQVEEDSALPANLSGVGGNAFGRPWDTALLAGCARHPAAVVRSGNRAAGGARRGGAPQVLRRSRRRWRTGRAAQRVRARPARFPAHAGERVERRRLEDRAARRRIVRRSQRGAAEGTTGLPCRPDQRPLLEHLRRTLGGCLGRLARTSNVIPVRESTMMTTPLSWPSAQRWPLGCTAIALVRLGSSR